MSYIDAVEATFRVGGGWMNAGVISRIVQWASDYTTDVTNIQLSGYWNKALLLQKKSSPPSMGG